MKKLARRAEEQGFVTERYFCSSDTESLDGILIKGDNETVGIVDGTPPHQWEPALTGVRDEIVDLGAFWDRKLLVAQKNEIVSLSKKKSAAFKKAYDYLRACGNLRTVTDSLLLGAADLQKAESAARRLAEGVRGDAGGTLPLTLRAIAMNGKVSLDSFEKNAVKLYRVGQLYGVGGIFMGKLLAALQNSGYALRQARSPVCPWITEGIFVEGSATAFILSDDRNADTETDERDSETYINPKRFISADALRQIRGELRYASKLYNDSESGALHALAEARVYHFLLEDIYKNAMDFKALSQFTDRFDAMR